MARLLVSRLLLRRVGKDRGALGQDVPENRWDKCLGLVVPQLLDVLVVRLAHTTPSLISCFERPLTQTSDDVTHLIN